MIIYSPHCLVLFNYAHGYFPISVVSAPVNIVMDVWFYEEYSSVRVPFVSCHAWPGCMVFNCMDNAQSILSCPSGRLPTLFPPFISYTEGKLILIKEFALLTITLNVRCSNVGIKHVQRAHMICMTRVINELNGPKNGNCYRYVWRATWNIDATGYMM